MKSLNQSFLKKYTAGFSILEVLISVAIFAMILVTVFSIFEYMNSANNKVRTDREVQDQAQASMNFITEAIRNASSIYTPTTTATQLSLESPIGGYILGEPTRFIDIFLCGTTICYHWDGQSYTQTTQLATTSRNITVTGLSFATGNTNGKPSVTVTLTMSYINNPGLSWMTGYVAKGGKVAQTSSITLTETATLRNSY